MRRRVVAVCLLLVTARTAAAQDLSLTSGPVTWTPSVALSQFGLDSNVFSAAPGHEVADITGTLTPSLGAALVSPRLNLASTVTYDFLYFERYPTERAVNRRYQARASVALWVFQPFVAGSSLRTRDRGGPEVDLRTRQLERTLSVGTGLLALSRVSFDVIASRTSTDVEQGQVFDGVDLSSELSRTSETGGVSFTVVLTPLARVSSGVSLTRQAFTRQRGKDQITRQANVSFAFAPDAVVSGRVGVGYLLLEPEDPEALGYRGLTTDVELSYTMLGATKFDGRYSKDTRVSIRELYSVQSTFELQIQQAIAGPFALVVKGNRQIVDYAGIPAREIEAHADVTDTYSAGFALRLSPTSSLTTTYEVTSRTATDPRQNMDRQRIATSISMGF